MSKKPFFLIATLFVLNTLLAQPTSEFRGAWVATVVNIDWPSQAGLSTEQQKAEYIRMVDLLQKNGMNAVIVQVRPCADAFYQSEYEPWSEWLTGKQGRAPEPFYDPLAFMIEEAHERKMEFHAWFNPYRAVMRIGESSITSSHITRRKPEWFVTYGTQKIFNPGLPEVWEYINTIVKDVVARYDVDGIHFDDYFYPYPLNGRPFPDESTYRKYGNGVEKEDWRRSNVDSVILKVSNTIKSLKPNVKFGISPFGVWRNASDDEEGSNTRAGITNYDDLYADILLWLENGWIDYAAPQLYWEIGHNKAAFETLTEWWSKHSYGKHIYIGHGIYRATERNQTGWKRRKELPDQINLLRKYPEIKGSIFFNAGIFYKNPFGWCDSLQSNYYNTVVSVPVMPWLTGEALVVNKTTTPASVVEKSIVPAPTNKTSSDTAAIVSPQPNSVVTSERPVLPVVKEEKPKVQTKPSPPLSATTAAVTIERVEQAGPNFYKIVIKKASQQNPSITAVKLYISYDESMLFEKSRQYSLKNDCDNCLFELWLAPIKNKCQLFVTCIYSNGTESAPLVFDAGKSLYFEKTDATRNNWQMR